MSLRQAEDKTPIKATSCDTQHANERSLPFHLLEPREIAAAPHVSCPPYAQPMHHSVPPIESLRQLLVHHLLDVSTPGRLDSDHCGLPAGAD